MARWRKSGYAQTGTLATGPAWCWLTAAGMKATGLGYPATRPSLGRLAHIRAVLAVRLWLESGEAYQAGQAWWRVAALDVGETDGDIEEPAVRLAGSLSTTSPGAAR